MLIHIINCDLQFKCRPQWIGFFFFPASQTSVEKKTNILHTFLYGLVIKKSYAETDLWAIIRADKIILLA